MRTMNEINRPVLSRHIRSFDVIIVPNGPLILNDAINHLKQVKMRLPSRFYTLLNIPKDREAQAIDILGVIERVLGLFHGYPEITQSFSYFLHNGHKMESAQIRYVWENEAEYPSDDDDGQNDDEQYDDFDYDYNNDNNEYNNDDGKDEDLDGDVSGVPLQEQQP